MGWARTEIAKQVLKEQHYERHENNGSSTLERSHLW